MDSAPASEPGKLAAATSAFALAAAITALLNTALSCAKDAHAPLKAFLKSLTDHDWTTQGLLNLALFVGLGFIFLKTRMTENIHPGRLTAGLIAAVAIAAIGLALWFAFV
jgi:hypothetical protein